MFVGIVICLEDCHNLRRALDFEAECHSRKRPWKPKRTWKKQVEEESVKIGLTNGRCPLMIEVVLLQIRLLLG